MEDIKKINKEDKIKYSFRIAKISQDIKDELCFKYPNLIFRANNRIYTDKSIFVLVFELKENNLEIIKDFITEYEIDDNNYDLFISFTTYKDITGISVPKNISNFIREVGGNIEFSIINLMNT